MLKQKKAVHTCFLELYYFFQTDYHDNQKFSVQLSPCVSLTKAASLSPYVGHNNGGHKCPPDSLQVRNKVSEIVFWQKELMNDITRQAVKHT